MLLFFIFVALAALGLWCCIYCAAGFFLTDDRLPVLICLLPQGHHPDGAIARYRLLKGLGLIRTPLLIVGAAQPKSAPDIEYCSLQDIPARLELERNNLD